MKLYFIPFACSLATRIAVLEAGLDAEFVAVTGNAPIPERVSPMGYVPALELESGFALSEGVAVLSYIADLAAEGVLAPPLVSDDRYRMLAWMNFTSTELHKDVFHPLLSADYGESDKTAARARAARPLGVLSAHLDGRAYLLDGFSVADAYLLSVLNWCETGGVDLAAWPVLLGWRTALRRRPSVAAAMATELPLLKAA